jgi:hypothetical protein
MLVQDRRIMTDRLYANAVSKFLAGNKVEAVDIIRRAFPAGTDVTPHIRSALGGHYVPSKRRT